MFFSTLYLNDAYLRGAKKLLQFGLEQKVAENTDAIHRDRWYRTNVLGACGTF